MCQYHKAAHTAVRGRGHLQDEQAAHSVCGPGTITFSLSRGDLQNFGDS